MSEMWVTRAYVPTAGDCGAIAERESDGKELYDEEIGEYIFALETQLGVARAKTAGLVKALKAIRDLDTTKLWPEERGSQMRNIARAALIDAEVPNVVNDA